MKDEERRMIAAFDGYSAKFLRLVFVVLGRRSLYDELHLRRSIYQVMVGREY
jgi:hypothetical protein